MKRGRFEHIHGMRDPASVQVGSRRGRDITYTVVLGQGVSVLRVHLVIPNRGGGEAVLGEGRSYIANSPPPFEQPGWGRVGGSDNPDPHMLACRPCERFIKVGTNKIAVVLWSACP